MLDYYFCPASIQNHCVARIFSHADNITSVHFFIKLTDTMVATTQARTRYSDTELEEFKGIIVEKLDKAQQQLKFYLRQMAEMADNEDGKIKNLDDAVGSSEREYLNSLAVRQRSHIQHLENALLRIQNKVYGVCRATGNLISKERLLAVPHATLSVDAKRKGLA